MFEEEKNQNCNSVIFIIIVNIHCDDKKKINIVTTKEKQTTHFYSKIETKIKKVQKIPPKKNKNKY